jgi:hypothetical protein
MAATQTDHGTSGGARVGKLVFGMRQSLDGYVAGVDGGLLMPPPGDTHRHFNDHVRSWPAFSTVVACTR